MDNTALLVSLLLPLFCLSKSLVVESLEPITTVVAVATAVGASVIIASLKCSMYECCNDYWFNPNITAIRHSLENRLHGQHLVVDTAVKTLSAHYRKKQPEKALVLSFHGWTGGGKNFVSRIISDNVYVKGMESRYVHVFVATLHFPHVSKVQIYKDQLHEWIRSNVSNCPNNMFIFDEMDKMPSGLIDAIKAYIDYYPEIDGVDYRKAVFIFLSNSAGKDINHKALNHWREGRRREDIDYKTMESVITLGAYNEDGGLWHSDLIQKHLINVFVPFLPMERKHVKMCIQDDLKLKNYRVTEEIVSRVADELQYFPEKYKLYSKSGCKRISQKVDLVMEDYNNVYK